MSETKSVFVSIIGRTNAGKSSLLNKLTGEKIAAVSPKTQTTRTRITGIVTQGDLQAVFMDTPGLHKAKNKLSEHMLEKAEESESDVDVILYMIDCTRMQNDNEQQTIKNITSGKIPCILVLNKTDLIKDKSVIAEKIKYYSETYNFTEIIPTSVKKSSGIGDIFNAIKKYAKISPHFFDDDKFTDQPERVIASEMIREKALLYLRDEVPHGVAVGIDKFSERDDKDILDISATIYCERESHKGIIIGKNGAMLKKISSSARKELEDFFQIQVFLKVWVKVAENWRTKENMIKRFGLD